MPSDPGTVTALATVAIATINMVGSVALAWIRARYGVTEAVNGHGSTPAPAPTSPPPAPAAGSPPGSP